MSMMYQMVYDHSPLSAHWSSKSAGWCWSEDRWQRCCKAVFRLLYVSAIDITSPITPVKRPTDRRISSRPTLSVYGASQSARRWMYLTCVASEFQDILTALEDPLWSCSEVDTCQCLQSGTLSFLALPPFPFQLDCLLHKRGCLGHFSEKGLCNHESGIQLVPMTKGHWTTDVL
jgi:hypothetical protein